jgi:hypothetical protein
MYGAPGVGKTQMCNMWKNKGFQNQTKSTIGVDMVGMAFQVGKDVVSVNLWDTGMRSACLMGFNFLSLSFVFFFFYLLFLLLFFRRMVFVSCCCRRRCLLRYYYLLTL